MQSSDVLWYEPLKKLRGARDVKGLPTDVRNELETLLDEVAEQRIRELSDGEGSPGELADMVELGLPNQIAVDAGILGARIYLERGKGYNAKQNERADLPAHPTPCRNHKIAK